MTAVDIPELIGEIDAELRRQGSPERAAAERAYLKSDLDHRGVSVPAVRALARGVVRAHPALDRAELLALVDGLWAGTVYERRRVAAELLEMRGGLLVAADIGLVERLLREARTWALVDELAVVVVGGLVERHPGLGSVLDRWAGDPDFWIRRSALLTLLGPLRRGGGDWDRFARYADGMLGETEFFIRKAIGWVLRETARRRPELVFEWLLPRAGQASGVTLREAVKPLSAAQREAVLAAR
jgi:3-methyladenine DNA glycosylase AlkD